MNLKKTVFALSEAYGASGCETPAAQTALDMLRVYCPDAAIVNGNVIGKFGIHRDGLPSLVLDAHIDQVGMIVTNITDEGFIKIGNLGGLDRRLLPAQQVVIHGKRDIKGIIASVPPHLAKAKGEGKVLTYEEVSIDTGMTKAELEEIVDLGDTITFDVKCKSLLGTRVTGGALDDRCGVAAILGALELLNGAETRYNVTVIFSTQEELGERGAAIGAYELNPDIALAVDVSFAYADGEDERKCGYLGKGAMIGISPCLSREISDGLIDAAKNLEIPYQLEIMNDMTSTNADRYSVSRDGSKACTVSIPLRNMHTPVEVIDLADVKYTAELLAAFISGSKGDENALSCTETQDTADADAESELLEELCLINGTSGDESAVRERILAEIGDLCDCRRDALGNLICFRKGRSDSGKKLMICAHMDEVGFIVTYIRGDGTLCFGEVGGIDPSVIIGRQVIVGKSGINGVVGSTAIHNIPAASRDEAPDVKKLYIDIGASSREEAEKLVNLGDCVYFASDFVHLGERRVKSKAIDDRAGCAEMLRLIKEEPEYDTYFVFNVQEEIGLRGARVSAFSVAPDFAIVLEATTAADIDGTSGADRVCELGNGPVVGFMDRSTVYDRELYRLAFDTAKELGIPCQTKTRIAGGNDSGAIHISGRGVRTIAVSVPCRYLHSPSCVIETADYESSLALVRELAKRVHEL